MWVGVDVGLRLQQEPGFAQALHYGQVGFSHWPAAKPAGVDEPPVWPHRVQRWQPFTPAHQPVVGAEGGGDVDQAAAFVGAHEASRDHPPSVGARGFGDYIDGPLVQDADQTLTLEPCGDAVQSAVGRGQPRPFLPP